MIGKQLWGPERKIGVSVGRWTPGADPSALAICRFAHLLCFLFSITLWLWFSYFLILEEMQSAVLFGNMRSFRERSSSPSTGAEERVAQPPPGFQQNGENHRLLDPHTHATTQKAPNSTIHSAQSDDTQPSAFQAWWQELILSAYAVGLFIAITAILSRFDKRTQPS